jgi:hypothetical protein
MDKLSEFFERYKTAQELMAELMFLKGRTRIVWVHGVLSFGGLLFLSMTILDRYRDRHQFAGWQEVAWLALTAAVYGLMGYGYGVWRWWLIERQVGRR